MLITTRAGHNRSATFWEQELCLLAAMPSCVQRKNDDARHKTPTRAAILELSAARTPARLANASTALSPGAYSGKATAASHISYLRGSCGSAVGLGWGLCLDLALGLGLGLSLGLSCSTCS